MYTPSLGTIERVWKNDFLGQVYLILWNLWGVGFFRWANIREQELGLVPKAWLNLLCSIDPRLSL